jgi:hypothetical protein
MILILLLGYATWLSIENKHAPKRFWMIALYLRLRGKTAIEYLQAQLETEPSNFVLDQLEKLAARVKLRHSVALKIAESLTHWDSPERVTARMFGILILLDFDLALATVEKSPKLLVVMLSGPPNLSQIADLETIILQQKSTYLKWLLIRACASTNCAPQVDTNRLLLGAVRTDSNFTIVLACVGYLWNRGVLPVFWLRQVIKGFVITKSKRLADYTTTEIFARLDANALPVLFDTMQAKSTSAKARDCATSLVCDHFERILQRGGIEANIIAITGWAQYILNSFELASEQSARKLGRLLGQSRAIDPLIVLITKGSNHKALPYTVSIFKLMCRFDPGYALPRLIAHAKKGDPNVRRVVMMGLADYPNTAVDELAESLLFDGVKYVRQPAAYHLRHDRFLREHALATLRDGMAHVHPPTAALARWLYRLTLFGR